MSLQYSLNYKLSKYSYFNKKTKVFSRPKVYSIELTNHCNLQCAMCPRRFSNRELGFMDFDLFKQIIKQSKRYSDEIILHNYGEPLLHPRLVDFINYCTANKIKTWLSTNATLLDEKKSLEILNSGLDKITLAFDSINKETYEELRRGANFEKTRDNIINFLKLKKKLKNKKMFAEVQIIKMKKTQNEVNDFMKEWQDLADEAYVKGFDTFCGQVDEIKEMGGQDNLFFPPDRKRFPCVLLWQSLVILWNGDVVPCCRDFQAKIILGNIKKDKLKNIWNSTKMQSLRQEHIDGIYKNTLCKDCLEWMGGTKENFTF